jgi:hypothetical protein
MNLTLWVLQELVAVAFLAHGWLFLSPQFQVVTSGAQAELGRALGGYINVVTPSGTNVVHGTVYSYVRAPQ